VRAETQEAVIAVVERVLARGEAVVAVAVVAFAEARGGVAGPREALGQRPGGAREARIPAGALVPAKLVASHIQARARGAAHRRRRVRLRKEHPLLGDPVHVGRVYVRGVVVESRVVGVALVVGDDYDDVRPLIAD